MIGGLRARDFQSLEIWSTRLRTLDTNIFQFNWLHANISEGVCPYCVAIGNVPESVRSVEASVDETGEVTLNWLAVPGDVFTLETTEDLVAPEWTQMGTTGTSSTAYVQMITNFVPDRLYVRVAEELP